MNESPIYLFIFKSKPVSIHKRCQPYDNIDQTVAQEQSVSEASQSASSLQLS